jgi:hypothetical protein
VSAEELFAALEDGPSYSRWVPPIRGVTWTSPRPFGKGTTRTVNLVGGARIDEVFWAWEPIGALASRSRPQAIAG